MGDIPLYICSCKYKIWKHNQQRWLEPSFPLPNPPITDREATRGLLYVGPLWRNNCKGRIWDGRCPWLCCWRFQCPQTANRKRQKGSKTKKQKQKTWLWLKRAPQSHLNLISSISTDCFRVVQIGHLICAVEFYDKTNTHTYSNVIFCISDHRLNKTFLWADTCRIFGTEDLTHQTHTHTYCTEHHRNTPDRSTVSPQ